MDFKVGTEVKLEDVIKNVENLINFVDDLTEGYREISYDASKDFNDVGGSLVNILEVLRKYRKENLKIR